MTDRANLQRHTFSYFSKRGGVQLRVIQQPLSDTEEASISGLTCPACGKGPFAQWRATGPHGGPDIIGANCQCGASARIIKDTDGPTAYWEWEVTVETTPYIPTREKMEAIK